VGVGKVSRIAVTIKERGLAVVDVAVEILAAGLIEDQLEVTGEAAALLLLALDDVGDGVVELRLRHLSGLMTAGHGVVGGRVVGEGDFDLNVDLAGVLLRLDHASQHVAERGIEVSAQAVESLASQGQRIVLAHDIFLLHFVVSRMYLFRQASQQKSCHSPSTFVVIHPSRSRSSFRWAFESMSSLSNGNETSLPQQSHEYTASPSQ